MIDLDDEQKLYGLKLALVQAKKAQARHTYPIGAVITTLEGKVIARSHNRVVPGRDPTAHAEVEVIRKAGAYLQANKRQSVLYTTLEPCLMCMGAILEANIAAVVWAFRDNYRGAASFVLEQYQKKKLVKPVVFAEPHPAMAAEV